MIKFPFQKFLTTKSLNLSRKQKHQKAAES